MLRSSVSFNLLEIATNESIGDNEIYTILYEIYNLSLQCLYSMRVEFVELTSFRVKKKRTPPPILNLTGEILFKIQRNHFGFRTQLFDIVQTRDIRTHEIRSCSTVDKYKPGQSVFIQQHRDRNDKHVTNVLQLHSKTYYEYVFFAHNTARARDVNR